MQDLSLIRLGSLFCFSTASFGFVLFMLKYPRGSEVRLWGIRTCHVLGFLGVVLLSLSKDQFDEISAMIFASLVVSLVGFELAEQFLKER
jgi:uncharacterized membrane protein YjjB (DUF3815 family)